MFYKKQVLILLSVLSLLNINCSGDDDTNNRTNANTSVNDTLNLTGTWSLDYYVNLGNLTEEILCEEKIAFTFLNDGTYTESSFSGVGISDCTTAVVTYGRWVDLGNNTYDIIPNGAIGSQSFIFKFKDNFTKFVHRVNTTRTDVYSKE